jgi:hypothetical protein
MTSHLICLLYYVVITTIMENKLKKIMPNPNLKLMDQVRETLRCLFDQENLLSIFVPGRVARACIFCRVLWIACTRRPGEFSWAGLTGKADFAGGFRLKPELEGILRTLGFGFEAFSFAALFAF